jgi:hypothetical protein
VEEECEPVVVPAQPPVPVPVPVATAAAVVVVVLVLQVDSEEDSREPPVGPVPPVARPVEAAVRSATAVGHPVGVRPVVGAATSRSSKLRRSPTTPRRTLLFPTAR